MFRGPVLSPERLGDPAFAALFAAVAKAPARPIRVGDILSAIRGHAPAARSPSAAPPEPLTRDDFCPHALAALDEFATVLPGVDLPFPLALPVLVGCLLRHANADALPRDRPAGETHERRDTGGPDGPFALPPQVAPSEDLTFRAVTADARGPYPFDGEPVYEAVFDRVGRALHRRQARHVFLTGERGVGKTTVVAELARRAAAGRYHHLRDRRFVLIDTRYTPPDEARVRLEAVLAHCAGRPDLVACLYGLPALLHGERGSNRPALLAALVGARCQLVALLTPQEHEEVAADDPELGEFFTRVDVPEPDPALALRLLTHYARGLGAKYGLAIDAAAVREAVTLTANYVLNDQLPAKALRVLSRACEDADYDRHQYGVAKDRITADEVVRVAAEWTGVPEGTLRGVAERTDYEAALGEVVFGQGHAVREVATELGLIKAGMTDPTKPASVMLFLGQTGTGKTELAKALARFYSTSKRLKTYTLGNCVEPHSVATIIGVPPGYVGSDRGGRLVNELNADPYGVFLLDEADKAHPDVLQPFLNLFDEGWVTDQRGARAHAQKSIFVLTTNVGQRMIADMHREGKPVEEIATRMKEALGQIRHGKSDRPVFTPEFLARIKRVIVFRPLDGAAMAAIARRLLDELRTGWAERRGKRLEIPDALTRYVGAAGHRRDAEAGGREGGRVIRKLLADWVEAPLQRAIAGQPEDYRRARRVAIEVDAALAPPESGPVPPPGIAVRFE